ncbi:MAG: LLM class flavin-dependent oxidoreductase [Chloroflexota bacterium]|nr:LLM class flavin-dependent oxidoreductase [Chloroflexota bacterium]
MGVGVALPSSGPFATPENIFAVAKKAEDLGYDDVWVNDHYSYPRSRLTRSSVGSFEAVTDQDPDFFESLTTLASVAGRHSRIGVAVHSLVLPLRDPRLFAKQVATIAELSGHRLTVAPGIGSAKVDFAAAEVPFERRGKIMDEHLAVLHAIITQDAPASFSGQRVHFDGGTFYPRPRNVRLWITGDSEPALKRVVRYATGWFSSGWPSIEAYRKLGERLTELAREAGRDDSSIVRASDPFVCIARTREEAFRVAEKSLTERFGSVERGLVHCGVGSSADVRDHLRRLTDAGARYFELRFICHDIRSCLGMIERFAQEVLPALSA